MINLLQFLIIIIIGSGWVFFLRHHRLNEFWRVMLMIVWSCLCLFVYWVAVVSYHTQQAQVLSLEPIAPTKNLLAYSVRED